MLKHKVTSGYRARVLVVEDEPNLIDGIRGILELDRYEVIAAANGVEALDILNTVTPPPDLILSDIMMPLMDGIQFLTAVRSEPRWVTIPFIFLTAKGTKTDMQQGKRLGVDDYLVKPFDAEDLLIAIESRLKRQSALNDASAESLSAVKRNILAILNHEFRTPLTFIVAYADMLNHQPAQDMPDEELLSFLKGVSSGATRLRGLIENFILLVELETGDAQRIFEWRRATITDLRPLLQAVCERSLHIIAPDRAYEVQIEDGIPAFVGDREYLTVALCQFVNNAVKFSPPESKVILGARAHDGEIHLWVQDFGRGIPDSEIDSIWQAFYQVDREHLEDQGTGSGLAIVQGIVRMHEGRVHAESAAGVGSTFSIILPAH